MQYSIKELRARHNLSQADMADRLGITRQSYIRWEGNIGNISLSNALRIANILQVELNDIRL